MSQDLCQYDGLGDLKGAQTLIWDTSKIDIISDIINIPLPNESQDIILVSEVFEHLSDPLRALDELCRILKPLGTLIITTPFCSPVHFSPEFYTSGFSEYYYKHHLTLRGLKIKELIANGDWFSVHKEFSQSFPMMAIRNKDKLFFCFYNIFSSIIIS